MNCNSSTLTWKLTRHIPKLPMMISYDNHVEHAFAQLDCPSKFILLKSPIALPLNTDIKLNDRIQIIQALTSSDPASAKITKAIGDYIDRQQTFLFIDISENFQILALSLSTPSAINNFNKYTLQNCVQNKLDSF